MQSEVEVTEKIPNHFLVFLFFYRLCKKNTGNINKNKTKRTVASKSPGKNNDVADAIGQLSVQETAKVKSKNIDVLAEYHKSERKKAANFVVIGMGKLETSGYIYWGEKREDSANFICFVGNFYRSC